MLRRMYDWVLAWAETPYGVPALALLAAAEACFFPIPPDVLLLAMGMAVPQRALWFALVATAGSVFGGIVGYGLGMGFWELLAPYFFQYIPGFTELQFEKVQGWFEAYGFWTVFAAGFTPIPYKVFTVASGVFQVHFGVFVVASIASRGLRFFLLSGLLMYFGRPVRAFIERYFNLLTLAILLLVLVLAAVLHWAR